MSRFVGLVVLALSVGCDQGAGTAAGAGSGSAGSAVAAAPVNNPGSGFSADLAKKLDTAGTGSDTASRTNNPTPDMKGSAEPVGSADAKGSADTKIAVTEPPKSGSADTKIEPPKSGSADTKVAATEPPKSGSADTKIEPPKSGSADTKVAVTEPPKSGSATPSTAPKMNGTVVISSGTTPKGPVSTPAELKAINIQLLPNWERDVEAAGTISFVTKIPGGTQTATFVYNYGLEDPKAPADREAYKKWLTEQKIFTSKDDRQKGVAWYLEGVDGAGKPAFRMVVLYGGKKLICYGSLYKDSSLGDLRDQVMIQAKQICETLTL